MFRDFGNIAEMKLGKHPLKEQSESLEGFPIEVAA